MPRRAEMAVLGAGSAGCAVAYYLAREGVSVTLIERTAVGSGASGYALGVLNPLVGTGIPGPAQPLAEAAFAMHKELWPALEDETGLSVQASARPHLDLCLTPGDVLERREAMKRWARLESFTARWLEPREVHDLEPRTTQELLGAVLVEDVGVLDSYRFTLALSKASETQGATFLRDEVVGLRTTGSRITGVTLANAAVECDAAVIALGPWSGEAAGWLGLPMVVEPLKGQILHLEALDPPLTYHIGGACSIVQKADGMVWVGSTEESAGFDLQPTPQARDLLTRQAAMMVPGVATVNVVSQTACLRPVTADRLPVLGRAPGWENIYVATGAEKKGILYSPAIGQAVADLVIRGETSLPITPFSPERFSS